MEGLKELLLSDSYDQLKESAINKLLDEPCIRQLSEEDFFHIVSYCLRLVASSENSNESRKKFAINVMYKLHTFRENEFNDISLQVISELVSSDTNQPVDILFSSKELIAIDFLEDTVTTELSDCLLKILQRLRGKISLAVLVDIANITRSNPKCLPPTQQHQLFCTEIINQISSLNIPANQFVNFMQDVMTVASMIQKIWLTSPGDIILPCLANIYTLIADSSMNPPSKSLAAFLNVTPKSQIDIALEKLFQLTGLSKSDDHVVKLAMVFCDWLIQWPKATQTSCWILSLFKFLTLDGRSSIVEEVISLKAPELMEKSVIPVIRASTAPVLSYLLITLRDQTPDKMDPILKPAINLVNILKAQQPKDTVSINLKTELVEGLYILSEKRSVMSDLLNELLLKTLSEYPRPSEQRVLARLNSIPSLFDSDLPKGCVEPAVLNCKNWLETRTVTGKIGLINLGNTCYVNSILQALYMNNDFTQLILSSNSTSNQHLLVQLQKVLIFLHYSFRAAYSPATFIKASRPPWFEVGRQQDCSEFLRYLMDSLYEQERANRSVLQCGHRWTVGAIKEEVGEAAQIAELRDEGETEQNIGELQRWVTEEDLTVGLPLSSESLPVDNCVQVADSLSNVHSDSTDSGIQSVGDGQEEKEKTCSALGKQNQSEQHQLSLIHKIFGGRMTTTYRCLACGTESHHQDFFTDLHLAFPDPTTPTALRVTRQVVSQPGDCLSLDSLLEFYFTAEKLQGENRYHCDNCSKLVQEAERILRVTEAPQHLLLTLLRFHYDRLLQRRGKITTQVSYPQRLDLPIDGGKTVSYVLYAVVIHSGITLDGGHYYTLARSSTLNAEDIHGNSSEPWFMFNDSQVSRTDFESLISLSRKYPTDTPYLLWYRRLDEQDVSDGTRRSPSAPIHLPEDLKRIVDEDNAKFLRERLQTMSRLTRSNWAPPKNDDEDSHRGDPFQDNNGSRFIF